MPPACLRLWWPYTTLLDIVVKVITWGFWAKRKTPRAAYALFCHADFILVCRAKFLILFYMIRSMIRGPIRDPVRDPICKLKSF